MTAIVAIASRTDQPRLELDILTGTIAPEVFRVPAVLAALQHYRTRLPLLLAGTGRSVEAFTSVTLTLEFDLGPACGEGEQVAARWVPCVCTVRATRARGPAIVQRVRSEWKGVRRHLNQSVG